MSLYLQIQVNLLNTTSVLIDSLLRITVGCSVSFLNKNLVRKGRVLRSYLRGILTRTAPRVMGDTEIEPFKSELVKFLSHLLMGCGLDIDCVKLLSCSEAMQAPCSALPLDKPTTLVPSL